MSKSLIFLVRFRISDGVNIFAGPKYAQTNLRNILLQGRSRPYFIIEYSTREEPCLDFHVSGRYLVCHAILIIEATSIIFYPPLKNEKGIKNPIDRHGLDDGIVNLTIVTSTLH